jgi:protein-disulfide isomerase
MLKLKFNPKVKISIILTLFIGIGIGYFVSIFLQNRKTWDKSIFGEPLFELDGKVWSSNTLPKNMLFDYYGFEKNLYDAKKQFILKSALRIALSHDSGKMQELPQLQNLLIGSPIDDAVAKNYYDSAVRSNGAAIFSGQSFEKVKNLIKMQLAFQKSNEIIDKKLEEMLSANRIKILLPALIGPPVEMDLALFPVRGNKNSEITFVEIGDYADGKSRKNEEELKKIVQKYANKVKFVSVNFPQDNYGLSGYYAKASYCAQEQGEEKFWGFHDKLFDLPHPDSETSESELKGNTPQNEQKPIMDIAKSSGLNVNQFSTCLTSGKAQQHLQKVRSQFLSLRGFQGVPSLYINNRPVSVSLNQVELALKEISIK